MTAEQDIERVLDHWFGEGPGRMPDGFLDRMIGQIDRVPQSRLARLRTRALTFALGIDGRLVVATLATAVIVAVVGGTVLSRLPAVGVLASPSPSVVPSASPSTGPSPSGQAVVDLAQLQATWTSVGTRPIPYGGLANIETTLVIGPGTAKVGEVGGESLNRVVLSGSDRIDIISETAPHLTGLKCNLGDRGTYVVSLSETASRLTLTSVGDACPTRAAVVTGDWDRTNLGLLAPGRHDATPFRPFGAGTPGLLSYAVPTGWTLQDENETSIAFFGPDPAIPTWVSVSSGVLPPVADTGCGPAPADVGHSPLVVATWLATLPGLAVTQPTPVTIGGLNGVMVDVSADGTGNKPCLTTPALGKDWPRERYILLDRGAGQTLLVAVEAQDAATWPAVLAAAMPVVNTFEFIR